MTYNCMLEEGANVVWCGSTMASVWAIDITCLAAVWLMWSSTCHGPVVPPLHLITAPNTVNNNSVMIGHQLLQSLFIHRVVLYTFHLGSCQPNSQCRTDTDQLFSILPPHKTSDVLPTSHKRFWPWFYPLESQGLWIGVSNWRCLTLVSIFILGLPKPSGLRQSEIPRRTKGRACNRSASGTQVMATP